MITFIPKVQLPEDCEIVSICCGSCPSDYFPGMCGDCLEWTGWEAIDSNGNVIGEVDINE